jgi:hypothetical protein
MKATIPPVQRRIAIRCVKLARKRRYTDFFFVFIRVFFPYPARRFVHSSELRPDGPDEYRVYISCTDTA